MIDLAHVQRMARYNHWQNRNLYGVADTLTDDERRRERGAFFGSIHGTLNHLLWGDRIWMSRFTDVPTARRRYSGLGVALFRLGGPQARARDFDDSLIHLGRRARPDWLDTDLTWFSRSAGRELQAPDLAPAHPFLQPPNASSRSGSLPVDAGRRKTA